ncbi:MAG: histidine kinase [Bacteroidota bacterium]
MPSEPPFRLSRAVLFGVPVATILVSGFAVHMGIGLTYGYPWRWSTLLDSLLRATLYVGVMWPVTVATSQWTLTRWALRSATDVARHVAALVASTLISFTTVSALLRLIDGVTPLPVFAIIAFVAAISTAVLATVLYGALAVQRLRASEAAAVAAELRALRAQINPHFLFNALNTIAALVRVRPEAAERVTETLADLFRYSLAASDRPTVTLAEEIDSARLYLDIEQARYGEDLTVEIDVPDELAGTPVPSLVLQPLVENAVKHGVRQRDGRGTVRIHAITTDRTLVVRVSDTGPGFGSDDIEHVLGRGTGLTNVAERLRAYHDRAELALDDTDGGGTVIVRLPLHP